MECKGYSSTNLSESINWNITRMECKVGSTADEAKVLENWNITRMECKVLNLRAGGHFTALLEYNQNGM